MSGDYTGYFCAGNFPGATKSTNRAKSAGREITLLITNKSLVQRTHTSIIAHRTGGSINEFKPRLQSQDSQSQEEISSDEFDEVDLEAIAQSRQQVARGEDVDWREVSARLRKEYLSE